MSRRLRELLPKFRDAGYSVELEDTTLTVNDETIVDCSDYPTCNIFLDEPVMLEADQLFYWFQLRTLEEQARKVQAKISEIDADEHQYMVKFKYDINTIPDKVLKAWGFVPGEPIEVAVDINLEQLVPKNVRVISRGVRPESLDMFARLIATFNPQDITMIPPAVAQLQILNRYCCVCCRKHPEELSDMLLLFPCSNLLCIYTAQIIGFSTRLSLIGLNLLAVLFQAAVSSDRQELLCQPFPTLFEGGDQVLLHPTEKRDVPLAKMLADQLVAGGFDNFPDAPLAHWLSVSNKTWMIELPETPIPGSIGFLTMAASPEKMIEFSQLKAQHGSVFAFHGSGVQNWHRILHDGLKNASNTALMTTGAVYGPGIYLSPHFNTSIGYAKPYQGMTCIAICEVIKEQLRKPVHSIWVCPVEAHVQIRFFFWFRTPGSVNVRASYDTEKPEFENLLRAVYERFSN